MKYILFVGENTACTNDIKMPNQFEIKSEYAILARTGFHTNVLEKGWVTRRI